MPHRVPPISKNVAFRQLSASALSTAGVLSGHGPSSKVSTTSFGRKKSYCLKCSKPKPGPPVVSISTMRARPMPPGLSHVAILTVGLDASPLSVGVAAAGVERALFWATRAGVTGAAVEDAGMTDTDATGAAGEAEAVAEPDAAISRIGDRRAIWAAGALLP
jgi:hypothetical protein